MYFPSSTVPEYSKQCNRKVRMCRDVGFIRVMTLWTLLLGCFSYPVRPLSVEILTRQLPLVVGQRGELACEAAGAHPPPAITWWLDDRQMPDTTSQQSSGDKNKTVSLLRWTPRVEEHGRVITCRATHLKLEGSTIQTSVRLNLHYAPIASLQLIYRLNTSDIYEGDDVHFECKVNSNPPAYKLVWDHDGVVVSQIQRVVAALAQLHLSTISKHEGGKYACIASNAVGDGKSQVVHIQIIYKPICKTSSAVILHVAINKPTKVICEVDGYPLAKTFTWFLNNSVALKEIETNKFSVEANGTSVLYYTPTTERDYGSLSCRATNLAGEQLQPCRYSILRAVRPDRLRNCTSVTLTEDSFEFKCVAGYDGGLHTSYFAEVWETKQLLANVSTPKPAWELRELGPGKLLRLVFYAYNAEGRSAPTSLRINSLSRLGSPTDENYGTVVNTSWALLVFGFPVGLLFIIITVCIIIQTVIIRRRTAPLVEDFTNVRDVQRTQPLPYCSVVSPPVVSSWGENNRREIRSTLPNIAPASRSQSDSALSDDRYDVTSIPFALPWMEVYTTRTRL